MALLPRLQNTWRTLAGGRRRDVDLDEELQSYVSELVDREIASGVPRDEARRRVLAGMGGVEQVKERTRDERAGAFVETLLRDLRYGCRTLLRTPIFAATVVATLALGIGANVTMFSVMYLVLWKALRYPDADRLVLLTANAKNVAGVGLAPAESRDLRAQSQTLEYIAAVSGVDANLEIDGELERVFAVSAHDDALAALGALPPALGRPLRAVIDEGERSVRSVIISDALWRRRFGSDPAVVGRHIQVNNLDVELVGVLRPGLRVFLPAASNAAEEIDIWFPRGEDADGDAARRHRDPATLARLRSGVTIAQAQADLDAIAARVVQDHPAAYAGSEFRMFVHPLQDMLTARARPALLALGVAVGFVLLIACVNVTNLMLARAKSRERELAVRRALGAPRGRVIRQLLAESLVLAVLGGTAGLLAGYAGVQLLDWLRPIHLPRQSQISIDAAVTAYTVLISVAVCLAFGMVPALRVTSAEGRDPLQAGRSGTTGQGIQRLQRGLVIAEVALSIIPLVAGGLMLRSFWNLTHAPIGFDPSGLVTAQIAISFRAVPDVEGRWTLHRNAIERVRQLSGVQAVSAAGPLPFAPHQMTRTFHRDDSDSPSVLASQQIVFPGYLNLTRIGLREGRDFTDEDVRQKRMVAMVDERVARQLWPEGALGRRLALEVGQKTEVFEVIGITNPTRATYVRDDDVAHVFLPYHFSPRELSLVIETNQNAAALGPSIRQAVESLGTRRPVTDIRPMAEYVADSVGEARFTMLLLVGFAVASLLLAAIGLYGTLAYLISQRTQEFGVRMALGASMRSVMSLVAREGALLTAIGAAVGLAGALALAGGIRGLLYGVKPVDTATVLGVVALIALVATASAALPAWRAARVDPSVALRAE